MSSRRGRRYSRVPLTTPLAGRVQESTHAKAHAAADALGMSLSAYLDALIARDEVDDEGRPVWWPIEQEQLPMTG